MGQPVCVEVRDPAEAAEALRRGCNTLRGVHTLPHGATI